MRAPSCAKRIAIPRPIPRLPPVISATRLTSGILLPIRNDAKPVSIAHQQNPHYRATSERSQKRIAGTHPVASFNEAAPPPPSYHPPAPASPPIPPPPSSTIAPPQPASTPAPESPP